MSVRRRVIGEIARRDHTYVSGIDIAALLRRLILFDQVVVKSVRLRELPFLVRALGKSGVISAFDSGILQLSCEFTCLIENIEVNGVSHVPPEHFSFGIVDAHDRDATLRPEFAALQSISGLRNRERAAIEDAAWKALVRPHANFGADLQSQVEHDLRTNSPALKIALIQALQSSGISLDTGGSGIELSVEETTHRIFRVHHNLSQLFGLPLKQCHRLLAKAVSGISGLNMRLADMATYSAITGFSEAEAPLLFGKLAGIIQPLNPVAKEGQFSRVATIAGVGEPLPGSRIDFEKLLEIRSSDECRAFRSWLDDADSLTDQELERELKSIRVKLGLWVSRTEARLLRFATITGIGFFPSAAVPAAMLGFVDNFLLEKIFPKSGVVSFLKMQYPSVFEK